MAESTKFKPNLRVESLKNSLMYWRLFDVMAALRSEEFKGGKYRILTWRHFDVMAALRSEVLKGGKNKI